MLPKKRCTACLPGIERKGAMAEVPKEHAKNAAADSSGVRAAGARRAALEYGQP